MDEIEKERMKERRNNEGKKEVKYDIYLVLHEVFCHEKQCSLQAGMPT